jgi:hypothetical protein
MNGQVRLHISRFLFLSLLLWSPQLWAQAAAGSQFGFLAGLTVPDAENTLPHHIAGIKGAAFISPTISLGGYYLVSGKSEGDDGLKFDYSIHGVEFGYHIPAAKGDTTVAFRTGVTKIRTEDVATSTSLIYSPYHYGLAVSYDYYLTNWVSLGFEGSYIHMEDSRTTGGGLKFEQDSFNMIGFLIVLQFRL